MRVSAQPALSGFTGVGKVCHGGWERKLQRADPLWRPTGDNSAEVVVGEAAQGHRRGLWDGIARAECDRIHNDEIMPNLA